jgi:hypothetical protein
MTEEEANRLDEEITNADITLTTTGQTGVFTKQRALIDTLDRVSADYIMTRALATKQMPIQIIGSIVHEKITQDA